MSTATDMLAQYLAAEAAVLTGKEFQMGDQRLRMEDLPEIRAGRQEWERKAAMERGAGGPTIGGLAYKLADLSGRC
ncbi:hypothetical protein [Niveibacterium sp. SC-1]|uniref:hypothetical protein n=1 Tax=Niveibacterium sp. SC-1 TaxID=3135646 RepID=UPI00311F57B0